MKTDRNTNIHEIREKIREFILEREWEKFHNPKDLAISISLESAELMELFQWKSLEEIEELENFPSFTTRISDELADIIIYSLSLANKLEIDISSAVLKKIEKNGQKYPVEKAYGSAKKYNEL